LLAARQHAAAPLRQGATEDATQRIRSITIETQVGVQPFARRVRIAQPRVQRISARLIEYERTLCNLFVRTIEHGRAAFDRSAVGHDGRITGAEFEVSAERRVELSAEIGTVGGLGWQL
jgi:hypothetical protein